LPGRSSYARLIPAARVAKTLVPPPERLRDAGAAADFREALSAFRDYVPGLADARSPQEASRALYTWLAGLALHLSKQAPPQAREAILAFALDDVALDMLMAMEALESGSKPPSLPTAAAAWTPTARLEREPELASSPERMLEAARRFRALHEALTWALQAARQARSPRVYTLAHPAVSFMLYTLPLERLDPASRAWISRIVCPILAHRAARAAAQQVLQGVDPRAAAQAIPRIRDPYCRIPWRALREAVEREAFEEQVLATLRQLLPTIGVEGRSLHEALEASLASVRRQVREAALAALTSDPFHAGVAAASLALARLALEEVRGVLTAKALRLQPDEYTTPLGLEA
jgi:hypothetical protein